MDLKFKIKVASTYIGKYRMMIYRLRDGCNVLTADAEPVNNALKYVKVSWIKKMQFSPIACLYYRPLGAERVKILL